MITPLPLPPPFPPKNMLTLHKKGEIIAHVDICVSITSFRSVMNIIMYIVETLKCGRGSTILTFSSEKLYYTQEEQLLIILTLGSRASTKNNGEKSQITERFDEKAL